jgi:hypothetical protein
VVRRGSPHGSFRAQLKTCEIDQENIAQFSEDGKVLEEHLTWQVAFMPLIDGSMKAL